MTRRVVLHIGQQKTGTTSIQTALVADRPRLAERGILYPDTGHARGRNGGLRPSHNALVHLLEGRSGAGMWQPLDQVEAELHAQLADQDPQTVVISAEHAIMAADQGEDVAGALAGIVEGERDIVAYIRRPDLFLSSFHRQLVRLGVPRLAPLHEPERLDFLFGTCQLDHRRAIEDHLRHGGTPRIVDFEAVDDAVGHFYDLVLGLDDPPEVGRTNPSVPMVFANLALAHVVNHGRLEQHQIQALIDHGEREKVDLLGPANRRRLLDWYRPQDRWLGSLVGTDGFFDDLDAMAEPPADAIDVDEADRRYAEVFAELLSRPPTPEPAPAPPPSLLRRIRRRLLA